MTLLAGYKSHGLPILVGDTICGFMANQSFHPRSLRKKVYIISPNLAIGWTRSLSSAEVVVSRVMNEFDGKTVTRRDFELFLKTLKFDGMIKSDVHLIGWIVDEEPKCFIWHSNDPTEVYYDDSYFVGTGEKYFESVLNSSLLHGGDRPRKPQQYSEEVAAVQQTLVYCGEAFFQEVMAAERWYESFGFAYEILLYAYEQFWPLGSTLYVGWEYRWDPKTQTGRPILSPFVAKLNFREHYSVLQKAQHHKLKIKNLRNYLVRPVYEHEIKEDLKKLRFDFNADHYVHYFVIHPPVDGKVFRLCYVSGKTQKGDKVWLRFKNGKPKFEVNTTPFDAIFRQALGVKGNWRGQYWTPYL